MTTGENGVNWQIHKPAIWNFALYISKHHNDAENTTAERKNGRSPYWTKPKKEDRKKKPERFYLKAEQGRINKFNNKIWSNSFKEQSRKECSLKKPLKWLIKIPYFSLIDMFDLLWVRHFYMNFIDDLGVPIVFFFIGDARLGSALLKYEIFRSESVNLLSPKNVWIQINMLYLGSLLHIDVKTVAYFVSSALSSGIYMTCKAQ
jgi:hypothetical protein